MRTSRIGWMGLGLAALLLAAPAVAQTPPQRPASGEPASMTASEIRELVDAARETAKATREAVDYTRVMPDILTQILTKLDKLEDKLDKIENALKQQGGTTARRR